MLCGFHIRRVRRYLLWVGMLVWVGEKKITNKFCINMKAHYLTRVNSNKPKVNTMKNTFIRFTVSFFSLFSLAVIYSQFMKIDLTQAPAYEVAVILVFAVACFTLTILPIVLIVAEYIETKKTKQ